MHATEAELLIEALLGMTESRLQAKVAGWSRPITREEIVALDASDNFRRVNFKPFKPLPRPWDAKPRKYGGNNKRAHTRAELRAAFEHPIGG